MRRCFVIDQVQKHTETAPDTPEKEGTKSSFPVKMHSIHRRNLKIRRTSVVQPWCKNQKKNRKSLKIKDLRFKMYSEDYLFSNQFMEDLAKIYRLRKYFPSFDDE